MGTEQQNEPGDGQSDPAQTEKKREPWWFEQPNPIDRFTGWLVAFTALLFLATIINALILWVTDHTLQQTLEANNRAWIAPVAAALHICRTVSLPGEGTLFPSNQPINEISFPPGRELIFTEEIANESKIAVWQGCFRYYTFGRPRSTKFCYWLRRSGAQWYWYSCGIEAD